MPEMPSATALTRSRAGASLLLAGSLWACGPAPQVGEAVAEWTPETPTLHHAHLNTMDAQGAIQWYEALWPDGSAGTVAGYPAFVADMAVLFNEVDSPPPGAWDPELERSAPQSPFWHIGGFVNTTGVFEELEQKGVSVLRLRLGPQDTQGAYRSGLTPYAGIRTAQQLDTAQTVEPRDGGFGYVVGPDGALVELTGGTRTQPSFSHVHLFHEQPQCAANWYVDNLGMSLPPRRDPETGDTVSQTRHENCSDAEKGEAGWPSLEAAGTIRAPRGTVRHGNGSLSFYPRQCDEARCGSDDALVPSRGQVLDHVAFLVTGLDSWVAHLEGNGVTIADGPYTFGEGMAVMVDGPDGLSIELVELSEGS